MNPNRRPMIAGNWKMYKTLPEAKVFLTALLEQLNSISGEEAAGYPEVMICPNALTLPALAELQQQHALPRSISLRLAAQNMESKDEGAYTGEISPAMLKAVGIESTLIGHSERRQYYNETDETVNQKLQAALNHGILPVVCIGETLEQREAGQTDAVIAQQLETGLKDLTAEQLKPLVIAYEPVWAIGTGKVCEADEANRVCGVIRAWLKQHVSPACAEACRVLYGGSAKPENSEQLMSQPEIDGLLIGGASLKVDSFSVMIQHGRQPATCSR